jgi:hypothetical protein
LLLRRVVDIKRFDDPYPTRRISPSAYDHVRGSGDPDDATRLSGVPLDGNAQHFTPKYFSLFDAAPSVSRSR